MAWPLVRVCVEVKPGDGGARHGGVRVLLLQPVEVGPRSDSARAVSGQDYVCGIGKARLRLQRLQDGVEDGVPRKMQAPGLGGGVCGLPAMKILRAVGDLQQ